MNVFAARYLPRRAGVHPRQTNRHPTAGPPRVVSEQATSKEPAHRLEPLFKGVLLGRFANCMDESIRGFTFTSRHIRVFRRVHVDAVARLSDRILHQNPVTCHFPRDDVVARHRATHVLRFSLF